MRVRSFLHQLRQGSSLSQESLMCVTWLTSWEMAWVLEMTGDCSALSVCHVATHLVPSLLPM